MSKHHASREWLIERISGAISIALLGWLIVNLICKQADLPALLGSTLNVTLLVIFIGNFLLYGTLAMKVVFEDYIQNLTIRNLLIKLMYVAGVAGFALAVAAIMNIGG